MYCLFCVVLCIVCVPNVYCSTATGWQPNCNLTNKSISIWKYQILVGYFTFWITLKLLPNEIEAVAHLAERQFLEDELTWNKGKSRRFWVGTRISIMSMEIEQDLERPKNLQQNLRHIFVSSLIKVAWIKKFESPTNQITRTNFKISWRVRYLILFKFLTEGL